MSIHIESDVAMDAGMPLESSLLSREQLIVNPTIADETLAEDTLRPFNDILADAQLGNELAFTDMWQRCEPVVRHAAGRIVGYDRAQDVTQLTALRAITNLPNFKAPENKENTERNCKAWLKRIAENASLDIVRRDKRIRFYSADEDNPLTGAPFIERQADTSGESAQDRVASADVTSIALSILPPEYREAVQAVDIDGLKYDEYSLLSGVKLGTVRSRLHRGREMLRKAIEEGQIEGLHAPRS